MATQKERSAAWYERNREAAKAYMREYARVNKDAFKNRKLMSMYGITLEQFNEILASQGGVCAICKGPQRGRGKYFHVDHDHVTGKVRGLLCHYCNTAIGSLRDDPSLPDAAAAYLRSFKE